MIEARNIVNTKQKLLKISYFQEICLLKNLQKKIKEKKLKKLHLLIKMKKKTTTQR